MGERLLAEVTAEYVWKNRKNGWLKYALQVLAAGPHLRSKLIGRLCKDVRKTLKKRLPGHKVWEEDKEDPWFEVCVTRDAWGELCVGLANWKHDSSEVAIGVYSEIALTDAASAEIKACLATKRRPWNRQRHSEWVWNIWPDQWSWCDPEFLLRVAEDTEVVVGEVAKDVVEVVELVDEVLTRVAKVG